MFNLSAFLIYIIITAFTPGPNNIMSMTNAARLGFKKSFRFNLGIFAGFAIIMPVCTLLSAAFFSLIPKVKIYMQIAGAIYMLYIAWKIWRSSSEIDAGEGKGASFGAGMLLQFVNAKIYIYTITSMSVYILPVYNSPPVLIGFSLLLALTAFLSTILWGLFGSAFCNIQKKYSKIVNGILALLVVYCAVSLFI